MGAVVLIVFAAVPFQPAIDLRDCDASGVTSGKRQN